MPEFRMTKNLYNHIEKEVLNFNNATKETYGMSVNEVIYSYLFSTEKEHFTINDWDEGKPNDPYWDDVLNMHCCNSFLLKMNININNFKE